MKESDPAKKCRVEVERRKESARTQKPSEDPMMQKYIHPDVPEDPANDGKLTVAERQR